jgi:DNA polymerase I-like protein with 3'-5' exonuclease and polymerase domains
VTGDLEFGVISRLLQSNPPLGIATGGVAVLFILLVGLRMLRGELRHYADDKASTAILAVYVAEADKQRERALKADAERDEAKKALLDVSLEYRGKLATAMEELQSSEEQRRRLEHELDRAQAELKRETTKVLAKDMELAGVRTAMEVLTSRVRELEETRGRRRTDPH